jgi:hypothetical protein
LQEASASSAYTFQSTSSLETKSLLKPAFARAEAGLSRLFFIKKGYSRTSTTRLEIKRWHTLPQQQNKQSYVV